MRVDAFDFDLPEQLIALRPAVPRDSARLLVANGDQKVDLTVTDLPDQLRHGDLLVFNDTRVIPAQLEAVRHRTDASGARIGLTLHQRLDAASWKAFARGAKKLSEGDRLDFDAELSATVVAKGEGGEVQLQFSQSGPALDQAIMRTGHVPLPPYIASKRQDDAQDRTDYQTIYARQDGAVAAPTAGLHFTDELFAALDARGINRCFVTLHVGAGTFLPVKADNTDEHVMHSEVGQITVETAALINRTREKGGRIVAVGTTSLRLLETAADKDGTVHSYADATDIFITPGYRFKCVDMLMTNFHLPRSTLMMLISAFAGMDQVRDVYAHAIAGNYRFYSYGDACLFTRTQGQKGEADG